VKKSEIRKKILKVRKLNNSKKTINFSKLFKLIKKKDIKSKVIGGYYPYNYEIDSIDILKKLEKKNYQISLPKINRGFKMNFFQWTSKDPLEINKFGIPEPVSEKIVYPEILLVPLVAFDKHFNRLGYGGGFYDRYIKKLKRKRNVITIGLAYSFQKVSKVPVNEYDIKLDCVVTN
tara:strand:+ start:778 stop:1305 length:528 start_codon:yes stop_codon:yes gene_type:complete